MSLSGYFEEDERYFHSRVLTTDLENDNSNFKEGKLVIVVTTNRQREKINLDKLDKLLPNERSYTCNSVDRSLTFNQMRPLSKDLSYIETGCLPHEIKIKVVFIIIL